MTGGVPEPVTGVRGQMVRVATTVGAAGRGVPMVATGGRVRCGVRVAAGAQVTGAQVTGAQVTGVGVTGVGVIGGGSVVATCCDPPFVHRLAPFARPGALPPRSH